MGAVNARKWPLSPRSASLQSPHIHYQCCNLTVPPRMTPRLTQSRSPANLRSATKELQTLRTLRRYAILDATSQSPLKKLVINSALLQPVRSSAIPHGSPPTTRLVWFRSGEPGPKAKVAKGLRFYGSTVATQVLLDPSSHF
jgi:hypothetical protein